MPDAKQTRNESTKMMDAVRDGFSVFGNLFSATQAYWAGMSRYTTDFFIPYLLATQYFNRVEGIRLLEESPVSSLEAYLKLLQNNLELLDRSFKGTVQMVNAFTQLEKEECAEALQQSFFELKHDKLVQYTSHLAEVLNMVSYTYPKALDAIGPEFGFHFESGKHDLVDQTDRFLLYRVSPSLPDVKTRFDAKPILIIPPFVLGVNILGFLPGDQRSYAHCYANLGFPTYIRALKDIDSSPALQEMTGEDDARDTRRFCEKITNLHGKPVTLNGYCQGGYAGLCDLLSGELDGLVDAFISCVSPIDGTRSKGLAHFLAQLPEQFNDLAYGTKILPNGNEVADGKLMGWVYKLKSIEQEIPAAAFFRDLMMFARQKNGNSKISKTAAALNYWLQNERSDLPLEITRMSFIAYNVPIAADGTLPVTLFGKKLNLKRLPEKGIPWLICYGTEDDLVEKETALAPLDFIDVEVTPFPKGHVAIATSWSSPDSTYALHTRFGEKNYRGPVLFHMDLDAALDRAANNPPDQNKAAAEAPKETPEAESTAKIGLEPRAPKQMPLEQHPAIRKTVPPKESGETLDAQADVAVDTMEAAPASDPAATEVKTEAAAPAVKKRTRKRTTKPRTAATRRAPQPASKAQSEVDQKES